MMSASICSLVLIGIIIFSFVTTPISNKKELFDTIQVGFLLSFFIPSPFLGIFIYHLGNQALKTSLDTKKKVNHLKYNGVLIKNMKYEVKEDTITLIFENRNGMKIPLQYKKLHVPLMRPDTCDILFDKDNPKRYYIDFDIY